MEEKEKNIIENKELDKDEKEKEEEKGKEIINNKDNNKNKEEENKTQDNMNDIVLNSKTDYEETLLNKNKEDNIPENTNEEKIILNNNIHVNEEYQNKNTMITDYIIKIQYSKFLHIPYFIFGNVLHLFCPCSKFKSERINLSKMPTPPFAISITGCKTYSFYKYKYNIYYYR